MCSISICSKKWSQRNQQLTPMMKFISWHCPFIIEIFRVFALFITLLIVAESSEIIQTRAIKYLQPSNIGLKRREKINILKYKSFKSTKKKINLLQSIDNWNLNVSYQNVVRYISLKWDKMLSGISLKFEILYCPKNISDLTAFFC